MLGPEVLRGKDKTLEAMCNVRAWTLQFWKSCANGSNIVALRRSAISEQKKCWELLTQTFDRFQTTFILRFLFNTLCLTDNCNSSSASCQENPAYYLTKPKYHTEEH